MYVAVKHQAAQEKVYWFIVPNNLKKYAYIGAKVYCDTQMGFNSGHIVAILGGNDDLGENEIKRITGNISSFKSIVAIETNYDIDNVYIPYEIEASKPNPDKILKRINEYYEDGVFHTKVIIRSDGTLKDGYTAYLVAKMFGHDTICGYCVT